MKVIDAPKLKRKRLLRESLERVAAFVVIGSGVVGLYQVNEFYSGIFPVETERKTTKRVCPHPKRIRKQRASAIPMSYFEALGEKEPKRVHETGHQLP